MAADSRNRIAIAPAHRLAPPPPDALGFDALETAAVVAVIALVTTAALNYYQVAVVKAASSEALEMTQLLRREVFEFRERHGRWPRTADVVFTNTLMSMADGARPKAYTGNNIADVELGELGAITVTYNQKMPALAGHHLTLRPVIVPGQPGAAVRWTCGKRVPALPAVALGTDRTDLPEDLLTYICRNGVEP